MFKNIAAAFIPWPLPIPDAVNALNTGPWEQVHELGAQHRRGAEFVIDGWRVHNIVGLKELASPCQCHIVSSQRSTFIPCNKNPSMHSCLRITTLWIEKQTHQSLNACEIH